MQLQRQCNIMAMLFRKRYDALFLIKLLTCYISSNNFKKIYIILVNAKWEKFREIRFCALFIFQTFYIKTLSIFYFL